MQKARRTLGVALAVLGAVGYLLFQKPTAWYFEIGLIADAILAVAALVVFGITFTGIEATDDGQFRIRKAGAYWRFMNFWWSSFRFAQSNPWHAAMSLCRAYWLTVATLILLPVFLLGVAAIVASLFLVAVNTLKDPGGTLAVFGIALAVFAGVYAVVYAAVRLFRYLEGRFPWMEKVRVNLVIACGIGAAIGLAYFMLYLVPIVGIEDHVRSKIFDQIRSGEVVSDGVFDQAREQATHIYWSAVGRIAAVLVGASALIVLAFRYWAPLRNSVIAKTLRRLKEETCPIVVAE